MTMRLNLTMNNLMLKAMIIFGRIVTLCVCCLCLANVTIAQEKNPKSTPFLESPIKFEQPGEKPLAPSELAARNSNQIETDQKTGTGDKTEFVDLAYGAYQRGFYLSAFKLALPRAESGDPAAQTLLAELYYKGLGVGRNRKKAASWYKFAANSGNREAQFSYANILAKGKVVPLDKKNAQAFMKKAADAGHNKAQFNLAQMIIAARPVYNAFVEAMPYYRKAAESGLPDAQYAMARIHASGKGVLHKDIARARKWMTLAAINGYDSAQVELAIWMAIGKGGPKDEKAALSWFRMAAGQGNVIGQNRLARMYAFGIGVERNIVIASKWHILARRAGKNDRELEKLFRSLAVEDQKKAIKAANVWRSQ